ncbi:MAG TPA: serine protease [Terriglobales bacterium]|nr:serine protease [Terriglobales bacterium]
MDENHRSSEKHTEVEPVCDAWQQMLQGALAVFLLLGAMLMVYHYAPVPDHDLQAQVQQLHRQVDELKQEEAMPSLVLNRYRNSICYIFGVYHVGFGQQPPSLHARISGTGFVVAQGLLATNRHVAEPWYGDPEADALIRKGAKPQLEKLVAFFPGFATPLNITPVALAAHGDLAVLSVDNSQVVDKLQPLPLAENAPTPGELVAVIGYPMGVLGMVAKSPTAIYDRLAYRRDDIGAANELAALSLIRPSATCGHLGDAIGDKLIYDAPTAHGASGGPVFNSRGEVIGINAAYIDGFSGGTLGVSVRALRPLIEVAEQQAPAAAQKLHQ